MLQKLLKVVVTFATGIYESCSFSPNAVDVVYPLIHKDLESKENL